MTVAHFYHIWAAGAWAPAAQEHDDALEAAGFPGKPKLGVTGPAEDRYVVAEWARLHGWQIAAEADEGFEQVTLSALRAWALTDTAPAIVLYAHAKGARHDLRGTNSAWRQEMTSRLVGEWRTIQLLLERHEAVGCCWRNRDEFPQMGLPGSGIFAGNFWWATRDYLRKLPEPGTSVPGEAEAWIGLGHPDVVDMLPGWTLHMLGDSSVVSSNAGLDVKD